MRAHTQTTLELEWRQQKITKGKTEQMACCCYSHMTVVGFVIKLSPYLIKHHDMKVRMCDGRDVPSRIPNVGTTRRRAGRFTRREPPPHNGPGVPGSRSPSSAQEKNYILRKSNPDSFGIIGNNLAMKQQDQIL
jgi:hypothetical protein